MILAWAGYTGNLCLTCLLTLLLPPMVFAINLGLVDSFSIMMRSGNWASPMGWAKDRERSQSKSCSSTPGLKFKFRKSLPLPAQSDVLFCGPFFLFLFRRCLLLSQLVTFFPNLVLPLLFVPKPEGGLKFSESS